ncbi:serine aminopeptidase domain-containing protein [Lactiplantibacillus plantarum]|uniref:serine aminopeptidase domain-containing protein n=1 Tax=Lactiplantibacillus plantarum TaxID=1590 RepID=UPI0021A2B8F9|nr:alpha/beta hydrolase [Lactiplantibacillus plantarum]MCT3234812.1 LPXTG cell wall anchor domain-containing protein [Lactiplantibacillus plantarum]
MKRNSQQSTTVDHYKMFKDGKHWVYAGITIAGLGSTLMLTTNALAATATPVSATTTSAANAPASVASQLSQAAGATATESTTTSSMTTGEDSNTTSNTDSSATTDTNQITTSTNATETSATEQATSAASATDQASEVANSASGTVTSQTTSATNSTAANTISGNEQAASSATSDATQVTDMVTATTKSTTDSAIDSTDDTSTNTNSTAAATPTSVATTSAASAATSDSGHGLIYETNDTTGNQKSTVTITQSGPYSVTWKKVTTSDKTDTTTVTLDASDIVAVVNTIKDLANQAATPSGKEQLAEAKAKLTTILDELKELPTDIASTIVGNVLYPIVFTGTGSEALSNLRTEMNQHRYDISNTWTGLDPVAYAADRAAAEEYYPTTVTWWDNVTKETWTLPEYNDPTQSVRAYYIQNGDSTKTVIIGQGWTEHVDWIGYVSKIWYDMGYNVLMPSQRGQFLSDGDNLTFGYQDKYDWLNWVKMVDERNGADSQVVFYGQSLGADTVLEAASVPGLSKSVKAVVSDAGYATLPELGSSLYNKAITAVSNALQSIGLPAITSLPFLSYDKIVAAMNARLIKEQGFSVDDLSATDAASKITIPLLLIHTQDDAFIPYTQSLELAAANHSANQEVWILPGTVGGHAAANNAILQYRQHLLAFLTPLLSVADAEDEAVDVDQVTDNRNQGAADNGTTTDSTAQDNVTDETTADEAISDHQTIVDNTTTDTTDITSDTTPDTTNHAKPNDDSTTSYVDLNDTDNTVDSDSDTAVDATRATTTVNQTSTIDQSIVIKGQVSDSIMVGSTATTNTDWLVNHDDSGSAVTASLLQDYSDQEASVTTPATVSATTTNTDSADLVAVSSPASKATTELPQTDETTQSWLATLGTSLLALATGIWAQVRRRFN